MVFKDRLRSSRMDRGFTQQQTADELGMALRSYQQYEQGKSEPPLYNLVKLADLFNIPTDYLLGRDSYLQSIGASFDEPRISPPRRPRRG